jgi:glycosyltransferase involved in cell wall biosynthesis
MSSVCILTHQFFRSRGERRSIGGVETYISALIELLVDNGNHITVLQTAEIAFEHKLSDHVLVIGVPGDLDSLKSFYGKSHRGKHSLTIFALFNIADCCLGERSVAIQHGINFDGFNSGAPPSLLPLVRLRRVFQLRKIKKQARRVVESIDRIICVDTNFINWMRAEFPFQRWDEKLFYVPNFGDPITRKELSEKRRRDGSSLRILIARRFEPFRGVLVMTEIIRSIARQYPHCHFIFAGKGPLEDEIRTQLDGIANCEITSIAYEDMMAACYNTDISVVPTIYCEGTSLACVEGLCAGNAVLATNSGGLCNLILPEYNGLLVQPTREALRDGLVRLLDDMSLRVRLGDRGHETAVECFSRDKWKQRVESVLAFAAGSESNG